MSALAVEVLYCSASRSLLSLVTNLGETLWCHRGQYSVFTVCLLATHADYTALLSSTLQVAATSPRPPTPASILLACRLTAEPRPTCPPASQPIDYWARPHCTVTRFILTSLLAMSISAVSFVIVNGSNVCRLRR